MEEAPYRCPSCGSTDPAAYVRCQRSGCPDGRDPRPDNRVADLERQIAELRAEVDTQRQSKEFAQRCCESAEAEIARLKALPLKDEVERVLRKHIKVDATGMSPVVAATFLTGFEEASIAILSCLRAGEQEGWRSMDSAPRDGTVIEAIYDGDFSSEPDKVFWQSEGRCCVLGSRAGAYKPGWTSVIAGNLPVDPPSHWRRAAPSEHGGERG